MTSIKIDEIDDVTLERIEKAAASKNRSIQSEIADILRNVLSPDERTMSLRRVADQLAAMTPQGIVQTDSVELLRADRDR